MATVTSRMDKSFHVNDDALSVSDATISIRVTGVGHGIAPFHKLGVNTKNLRNGADDDERGDADI
jgi:hypothetical protein